MHICIVSCFLLLGTISSAQKFIAFDKVQISDNEVIPQIRKNVPNSNINLTSKITPRPVYKPVVVSHVKSKGQSGHQQQQIKKDQELQQADSSGPPRVYVLGTEQKKVQPRATVGKTEAVAAGDASVGYQQYNNHIFGGGQQRYLPPINPGWNAGGCSTCGGSYDFSYRQRCCTVGHTICCTVHRPNYNGGVGVLGQFDQYQQYGNDRWGWNNHREKPGTCYRPSYQPGWNGWNNGWSNNHNAGYYYQRSDDIDRDFQTGGYQHGGGIGGGYGGSHYSGGGGGGGGYGHGGGGGYGHGGGGGYGHGGGGGYGHGGGGGHGGIGIFGGNNYGHQQWNYCRRDYECPGNKKCCYGTCSTPSFIG